VVHARLILDLTKFLDQKELLLLKQPTKVHWDKDHSQSASMLPTGHNTEVVSLALVVNQSTMPLQPLGMMLPVTGSLRTLGVPVGVKMVTSDLLQEIPVTF
jgi:hypothetical protein